MDRTDIDILLYKLKNDDIGYKELLDRLLNQIDGQTNEDEYA